MYTLYYCTSFTTANPVILYTLYHCKSGTTVHPVLLYTLYYCTPFTTVHPVLLCTLYYCIHPVLLYTLYYCTPCTTVHPVLLYTLYYCTPCTTVHTLLLYTLYIIGPNISKRKRGWNGFILKTTPRRHIFVGMMSLQYRYVLILICFVVFGKINKNIYFYFRYSYAWTAHILFHVGVCN